MARSRLSVAGVEIRWRCDPSLLAEDERRQLKLNHYPGGLADYLTDATTDKTISFAEISELDGQKFEWAITWLGPGEDGFFRAIVTRCQPRRAELMKWLPSSHCSWIAQFGDLVGNKGS